VTRREVAALVLEDNAVIARGLAALLADAAPGSRIVLIGDGGTVQPMDFDLVLCGPSRLRAWSGRLADLEDRPASVAVIVNPADVDFTALLAAGIAVLWDYRGGTSSFTAAVQAALAGQAWVSESLTAAMAAGVGEQLRRDLRAADFGLTLREGEILQLLATGASNREIAARLFISQNTVKNHVRSVLEKLHAASRTEAVMIGARAGVIDVRAGRP
jgi:two-component system NarL family response regulator